MSLTQCASNQLYCRNVGAWTNAGYCILASEFNCGKFPECECPRIKADPDIAGVGMIAAFIVSASFTILLSIACLILQTNDSTSSNVFDNFFKKRVRDPIRRLVGSSRAELYSESLFVMITMISDQQLVTGIAIVAAAIGAMRTRAITVFHFNIVTDMAWFSSNVHLFSLMVTRTFLDGKRAQPRHHQDLRGLRALPLTIRIVSMVSLAVLLLYAAEVSSYELWNEKLNCPATCVRLGKRGGMPLVQMIVTYIFIIQSYTTQILLIIPAVRRAWERRIYPWLLSRDRGVQDRFSPRSATGRLYFAFRAIVLVAFYFFTSEVEFVLEMLAWYGLGLYWTLTDRMAGHKNMEAPDIATENHVGFGQLVPLLLLLLALLAFLEQYKQRKRPELPSDSERLRSFSWTTALEVPLKPLESNSGHRREVLEPPEAFTRKLSHPK